TAEAEDARRHSRALVEKLTAGQVTRKFPTDRAKAFRSRGDLLVLAERDREAGQAFRQGLDAARDNPLGLPDPADFLADCPDPESRNPAEAVALARKAVALAPDDGTFWATLGVALYRAGEWQESVTALHKSLDLRNGGTGGDGFWLALAHWRAG